MARTNVIDRANNRCDASPAEKASLAVALVAVAAFWPALAVVLTIGALEILSLTAGIDSFATTAPATIAFGVALAILVVASVAGPTAYANANRKQPMA